MVMPGPPDPPRSDLPGSHRFVPAPLLLRFLARILDALVTLPLIMVAGAVADGSTQALLSLGSLAVYEIMMVSARGQTVGKIVVGIRIVDTGTGALPIPHQVATRWFVLFAASIVVALVPSLVTFDVIYTVVILVSVLRPPLRRGIHDQASGTVVVSLR